MALRLCFLPPPLSRPPPRLSPLHFCRGVDIAPSICEKRESPRRRRRCPKKRERELCSFRLEEEGAFSGFRGGEGSFCLVGGCAESCSGRRKLSSLSLLLLLVVLLLLEPGHTHKGGGGRSVLPQLAFCFRIWHEVREGEGGGATPNTGGVVACTEP